MSYRYFKTLIISSLIALFAVPASAQLQRIMVHTTAQSMAMTDQYSTIEFTAEIIEAYQNEYTDEPATFPGGNIALMHFINSSRHYPAEAYRKGISGRVICSFVVQPDGTITHINILRGVEPTIDREALRIINSMPQWKAAKINGDPVPVYSTLAINFRL